MEETKVRSRTQTLHHKRRWKMVEPHKRIGAIDSLNKNNSKNSVNEFRGNEWRKEHTFYALQSRYTTSARYDGKHMLPYHCLISISAVILKLMVKIASIFGSYRFLRISWHDIFSLSDHFPASWNLYIPRDLAESQSKCSSSRQSNPEVNYRTHLKDYCVS